MSLSNAELRRFISSAFSEEDFDAFCFDYFPEERQNFGSGTSMRMKVIVLIDACQRTARIPELIAHLKAERPGRFPRSLEPDSEEIPSSASHQISFPDSVEKATKLQRRLRHFLTKSNYEGATGVYEVLQKQRLLELLDPLEADWLEALIMIAFHGFDSEVTTEDLFFSALQIQDVWPDALAGAILCLVDRGGQSSDREVWRLLRGLPDKIQSEELRSRFLAFIRKWAVAPDDCAPDIPVMKNRVSKAYSVLIPETIAEAIHGTNPFGAERAEEEEETLYLKGGFWPMHLAYQAVMESIRPLVIFGASGSGLTALAKGLQFHESRLCKEFWVYHQPKSNNDFQVDSICEPMAGILLDYMCQKHSRWEHMADYQLNYCVDWLKQILSRETVKGRLIGSLITNDMPVARAERMRVRIEHVLEQGSGSEGEQKNWKALLTAASYILQAFQFESIQIMYDVGGGELDLILPILEWSRGAQAVPQFVQITLFVEQSNVGKLRESVSGTEFFELGWSPNELRALTEHRFLQLCQQRNVHSVFASGFDDFFDVVPRTPRQLARLWSQLLPLVSNGELITADAVEKALSSLEN